MDNLDAQIAQMQTQLTSALKRGELENSPQMRQMGARLEWMRHYWAIHRQSQLGTDNQEVTHVSHIH